MVGSFHKMLKITNGRALRRMKKSCNALRLLQLANSGKARSYGEATMNLPNVLKPKEYSAHKQPLSNQCPAEMYGHFSSK